MFYKKSDQQNGHREVLMITPRNSSKFSKKFSLFQESANGMEECSEENSLNLSNCYKPLSTKHWRQLMSLPEQQLSQTVFVVESLDLNLMKTVWENQNRLVVVHTTEDRDEHSKVIQETFKALKTNANRTAFPYQLLKKEDLVLHKEMKNKILVKLFQKMQPNDFQGKFYYTRT
jgi:hypothetical protein